LDKSQEDSARQHATLAGNAGLVPSLIEAGAGSAGTAPVASAAPPGTAASAAASVVATAPLAALGSVNIIAALTDIYNQRDDRWQVDAHLVSPLLKIGSNLALTIRSQRDGFVYVFYRGTQPDSFYLLFPNQLDGMNSISANQDLQIPRKDWSVTALGPAGTDHLMVMVTDTPRDFSALALPAEYVSQSGPFEKIQPSVQAVARISQAATVSAALAKPECHSAEKRDLAVAKRCSNVFGASVLSVEETD
jgi:hypothetical protein